MKIQTVLFGRKCTVDVEALPTFKKKEALVQQAIAYRGKPEEAEIVAKIIRINRTIKRKGYFVTTAVEDLYPQ